MGIIEKKFYKQTHPAIDFSLPPPVGNLAVDLDDVSLQQGQLLNVSGAEVIAGYCNTHHARGKH